MATWSLVLHEAKRNMYIAKTGINPFKQMWKVLKFGLQNKHPLNRSAFTFCEDTTPSRLDLGKHQYGGPFTTEEVEDVKTFLRLLLLLVTLFGYHMAGDGFAIVHHMQKYSCPSLAVWGLFTFNPTSTTSLVVLISIPVMKCLPKIHKFTPNMLKQIGIGLMILVIQDIIYSLLTLQPIIYSYTEDITSDNDKSMQCLSIRMNKTSSNMVPVDNTFLVLIVHQVLNGLAQLLVHMTTLEFICAQAPRTLQGLLIGLWYAMFGIRYMLMCSLDHVFTSSLGIFIYQTVRTSLVLLSPILYLRVSRAYKYRIRDWVVHVQWMVEDVIERRMDQEQQYWRSKMNTEHMLFNPSSTPSNDYRTFH